MDARKVSILSMIAATSCCLPPLILLGLMLVGVSIVGVAGLSSTIGRLKWYFVALSIVGVGVSHWLYVREKKKCSAQACSMPGKNLTRAMLTCSTVVVFGFLAWSVYPYLLGTESAPMLTEGQSSNFVVYSIDGMTCGTCEIAVNDAIRTTGLVDSVKSNFARGEAYVWFNREPQSEAIKKAVNAVGYKVTLATAAKGK